MDTSIVEIYLIIGISLIYCWHGHHDTIWMLLVNRIHSMVGSWEMSFMELTPYMKFNLWLLPRCNFIIKSMQYIICVMVFLSSLNWAWMGLFAILHPEWYMHGDLHWKDEVDLHNLVEACRGHDSTLSSMKFFSFVYLLVGLLKIDNLW